MKYLNKKIFLLFLFFYLLLGSYNSINTGISFDERYEELNWNFNFSTIKDLSNGIIGKQEFNRDKFDIEVKSFVGYGIGFQIVSQPIQFLLKDLPVDADLEYLDISEPGSFEDYVKFNKVEMVTIKEDDDGYIDEDLENWSYDGEDIGVLDEEMVTDKVDMIKHDIFKMMSSRFEVIKDSKGEISDNEGNRYSIIDTEEEVEDVTLSDLLVPITDFLSLGMNLKSFC